MKIYFDNSATTAIREECLAKYCEISREVFGNPSSLHKEGFAAERELNTARAEVLSSVADKLSSVIFTASGSEANNLAIIGRALSKERYLRGARIITTDGEHASVSSPVEKLAKMGFDVVKISTRGGTIDMHELEEALTPNVILVTVMHVNNETGAVYDIPAVSRLTHAKCPDALVHVDATQSYMKIPFTKKSLGADMITVSSHKIEGPKGVGALIVGPEVIKSRGLSPLILGGGQEQGLRSGTENVPAVAAFGEAVRLAKGCVSDTNGKCSALRDKLINMLSDAPFSAISITRPPIHAPHILNITLPSIRSETMLHFLSAKGIFVSSGSACSSNSEDVSSALIAYGRTPEEADCSIRISFSHRNTEEEVEIFAQALAEGLERLARRRR